MPSGSSAAVIVSVTAYLTCVPKIDTKPTSCSSNHRGTPFARVLLIGGAGAVPAGGATHAVPGRFRASSRPALGPVCEVLAALAPGRVLPFAPGNSRKRGPELSEAIRLCKCRGGAPEGERPPPVPSPASGGGKVARGRVPSDTALVGCAFRRSASLFRRRGRIWKSLSCLVVGKARARTNNAPRECCCSSSP